MKKTLTEAARKYMFEGEDEEEKQITTSASEDAEAVEELEKEEEITPEDQLMHSPDVVLKAYSELMKVAEQVKARSTQIGTIIEKVLLESYSYDVNKIRILLDDIEILYDDVHNADYTMSHVLDMLVQKVNGEHNAV